MSRIRPLAALLAALIIPACHGGSDALFAVTALVSLNSAGSPSTGYTQRPAVSADGRFVAFESGATDLVAGDSNGVSDVFVHDRLTGITERVSVDAAGVQGNDASYAAAISGDGNVVAFISIATNLVAGDDNDYQDIFVRDRQAGTTTRISVDSAGAQADGASGDVQLSSSGRYAVFQSDATNLVAGDSNAQTDIFLRDRQADTTIRVSVDSAGTQANGGSGIPRISADGVVIAFQSSATNLVAGDTNGVPDVFVYERNGATTVRASVTSAGGQATAASSTGAVSGNGRYVAFSSIATDLVAGDTNGTSDVFLFDTEIGTTVRVSPTAAGAQSNGDSAVRGISDDGRTVLFDSDSTNIVAGDTNGEQDVFLCDTMTGAITWISIAIGGGSNDGWSGGSAISGDGRFVAFTSEATNLVPGDTNAQGDVFVRGPVR